MSFIEWKYFALLGFSLGFVGACSGGGASDGGGGSSSGGNAGSTSGASGSSGSSTGGSSTSGGGAGGSAGSSGGGSVTCAAPAGPRDEVCNCPPCPEWKAIALPPSPAPDELFVARSGRVFIHTTELFFSDALDGNWTPTGADAVVLHEGGDGRLVANLEGDLALSEDGGMTWTSLGTPTDSRGAAWVTPQGIYSGFQTLRRTTDQGATWATMGASQNGFSALPNGTLFGLAMYYHPGQNRWIDFRPERDDIDDFFTVNFATDSGAILRAGDAGVIVSRNFGATWETCWNLKPDEVAANASSLVAARFERTGIHVPREGGWAQIGPAKTGVSRDHGVLPDGRVIALGVYTGRFEPIVTGATALVVTAAPVDGTPVTGPSFPVMCSDETLSGGEEHVNCGGACAPCKNWHLLPQAPISNFLTYTLLASGTLLSSTTSGMSRSTDGGLTWSPLTGHPEPYSVAVAPDDTIYVATSLDHFYVSTDEGTTFEQVGPPDIPVSAWDLLVTQSGAIIAHNQGNIGRSIDGGVTWEELTTLPNGSAPPFVLPTGELFLPASYDLHRSLDDGDTWEALNPPFSGAVYRASPPRTIVAGTGSEVYLSEDAGSSWRPITLPEPEPEYWRLLPISEGRYLYAGTRTFIADSGSALTWQEADDSGRYNALPELELSNGWIIGRGYFDNMPRLTRAPADW